jgi:hypothetical protein
MYSTTMESFDDFESFLTLGQTSASKSKDDGSTMQTIMATGTSLYSYCLIEAISNQYKQPLQVARRSQTTSPLIS